MSKVMILRDDDGGIQVELESDDRDLYGMAKKALELWKEISFHSSGSTDLSPSAEVSFSGPDNEELRRAGFDIGQLTGSPATSA